MPVPITIDHQPALPDDVDLVAIGVRSGEVAADAPGVDEHLVELSGFEAKPGQTLLTSTDDGLRLLVGLGEVPKLEDYRKIGAAISKASLKRESVAVDALADLEGADRLAAAGALVEGLALGSYGFSDFKDPAPGTALDRVTVVTKGGKRMTEAIETAAQAAQVVGSVRDLVNMPGGIMTPVAFAAQAEEMAAEAGLEIEVMDRDDMVEAGLGGLLGVSRGSSQEPRLVKLVHRPEGRSKGAVALVGKGVTFDSGGLSIKPANSMEGMKTDMAGAAAVLGAMVLAPLVAPKLEVRAYIPLTDNMLGPDATRVGDILRIRNDKTVEVLNTDAEGRLILADALCLAAEDEPDAIIDLATLTGACMVALGERTAGLMGSHQPLVDRVREAAAAAREDVWPLPLPEYLRKTLDSDIADLRNISTGPYGGALTAGIFLQEFVGEVPWAHIDIAGPSNTKAAYDEVSKGGTGFGVFTLARLLADWTKLPKD